MKLNEILPSTDELTFLIGAGISKDPPSNLPSAIEIVKSLLLTCVPKEEISHILGLEYLRYEMFVELFQENIDPDIKFLDFIDQVKEPNHNHKFLADMISIGNFVITTNYDNLIEHALCGILEDSSNPRKKIVPVITKNDFLKYHDPKRWFNKGKWLVYKLHGSKRNIITEESTEKSILTTISDLVKNKEEEDTLRTHPYKRKAFNALMKGRTLIVIGYSGSDDFDITSTLSEVSELEKILWITHEEEHSTITIEQLNPLISSESIQNMSGSEKRLYYFASTVPFKIYQVRGLTSTILKEIGLIKEINSSSESLLNDVSNKRNISSQPNFPDWIKSVYFDVSETQKMNFAWACLYRFGLYERALNLAQKGLNLSENNKDLEGKHNFLDKIISIHSCREEYDDALKIAWKLFEHYKKKKILEGKAKELNIIGGLYIRKMNYKKALKYVKKSYRLNQFLKKNYGMNESLFLIARIYTNLRKYGKALRIYKKLLKISEIIGDLYLKSTIFDSIGRIYQDRNLLDKSIPYFLEAITIGELLGDLPNNFITLDNIAMNYYERKEWNKAIRYFKKALEIAESIGEKDIAFIQYDQSIGHLLPYLSECYENIGEFDSALEYIKRCFERDKAFGIEQSVIIDLETMGRIYLKMGRKLDAEHYFSQIESLKTNLS